MEIDENKILFLAQITKKAGVAKKVQGLYNAAKNNGYDADYMNFKTVTELRRIILSTNAKYILMRTVTYRNACLFLSLLRARNQGRILILDVPTPHRVYINEVKMQNRPFVRRIAKCCLMYLNGPWSLWPFHRIIEYAEESSFFMIKNRSKTKVLGNGIDVSRVPLREKQYPDADHEIRLLAVASSISGWHGFDRVIKAMIEWEKMERKQRITLDVVGSSDSIHAKNLMMLAEKGGVSSFVRFHGFLSATELQHLYSKDSLAVGSLGLYRIGLSTSSILKIREYCLAGIPFIAAGNDPDFKDDVPFRFLVSNDDKIDDIISIFESFSSRRQSFTDEEIRQYAIEYLSYNSKFKEIIRGL
ncbi:MAG: hypothetical protein IJM58_02465 [Muribaculaceae bacterium]|nr:hypothetical protein [Muribaculaceae bacterium]